MDEFVEHYTKHSQLYPAERPHKIRKIWHVKTLARGELKRRSATSRL